MLAPIVECRDMTLPLQTLYTWTNKNGLVQVYWTGDGNAPFGDFAWFGRGVEISNGVVTRVINQIYYD